MLALDMVVTDDTVRALADLFLLRHRFDHLSTLCSHATSAYHNAPYTAWHPFRDDSNSPRRLLSTYLTSIHNDRNLALRAMASLCPHLDLMAAPIMPGRASSRPSVLATQCTTCLAFQEPDGTFHPPSTMGHP